jgi:hypothetical protein
VAGLALNMGNKTKTAVVFKFVEIVEPVYHLFLLSARSPGSLCSRTSNRTSVLISTWEP